MALTEPISIMESKCVIPLFVRFEVPALKFEHRLAFLFRADNYRPVLDKVTRTITNLEVNLKEDLFAPRNKFDMPQELQDLEYHVVENFKHWQALVTDWKGSALKHIRNIQQELDQARERLGELEQEVKQSAQEVEESRKEAEAAAKEAETYAEMMWTKSPHFCQRCSGLHVAREESMGASSTESTRPDVGPQLVKESSRGCSERSARTTSATSWATSSNVATRALRRMMSAEQQQQQADTRTKYRPASVVPSAREEYCSPDHSRSPRDLGSRNESTTTSQCSRRNSSTTTSQYSVATQQQVECTRARSASGTRFGRALKACKNVLVTR